jgi:hypothetical protein
MDEVVFSGAKIPGSRRIAIVPKVNMVTPKAF